MFGIFSKKESVGLNKNNRGAWGDGQAVLSAIDDGVLAIDPNGNVRIMNMAAEQTVGWSNGDAVGLSFESVFQLLDKEGKPFEREVNPIRQALLSFNTFTSRELSLKTSSGKIIPIFIRINPIDSLRSGLVIVFRNISRELKESREQNEFISTASHEMRTPVASIEGYLGLALNPTTATIDGRARTYLEKAHESVKHLGQLFQDLLDITRSEDGRLKNEPVVLDAVEFSREVWDGLRLKAEDKGLEYVFDLDEQKTSEKVLTPVYFIHADRDHLREILDNLFENAIKYTPKGRVSVNITGDNNNVKISVKDSGIGIPAEDIPHLFQKFYRVDNSSTREIGGTGLGLYLSRRLVESLGGKMELESEFQKGSTFTVKLPRLTREQADKFRAEEKNKEVAEDKESNKDEIFDSSKEIFAHKVSSTSSSNSDITDSNIQKPQSPIEDSPQEVEPKNNNYDSYVNTNHVDNTPPPQNNQNSARSYYDQEQAIRNYQIQQYYARQKAAMAARVRAEQARYAQAMAQQNMQRPTSQVQQNPYFPDNQQTTVVQASNNTPPSRPENVSQSQPPTVPIPQPTLSDIEKMREEYVRRIMNERNNTR